MQRINPAFIMLGLAVALTACDVNQITFGDTAGTVRNRWEPWLETGRGTYTAWYSGDRIELDIDFTFTNRGRRTVAIPRCTVPHQPALDKLVGGEWVEVVASRSQCWERPALLGAGRSEQFTYRVRAGRLYSGLEPEFRTTQVPGTYRLRWDIYEVDEFSQFGIGALLPIEHRVSNEFRIVR
jgi:hypothetical protein